ncbi:nitroreductase [Streptomyces armeniacus]|uniref:Nitroreductase n=1 Tax=Streptomyces armeniacus TaxID=83291 RepID=A0A345XUF6_9ACTN|nr:nitroreductase family protein [Streptomyces armeniacus]AXK35272.1 nitroreductase [Streptomyces armeniacus]
MSVRPLDSGTVTGLISDATTAPSLHNAQPWRFRFRSRSRTFELRSDPGRAFRRTDPEGRAAHLGCGAALFNLRVAVADAGWGAETRLLPYRQEGPSGPSGPSAPGTATPSGARGPLLATVRLSDTGAPDAELAALYPALSRRRTSRHPFTEDREIPADVQAELTRAARKEGAQLVLPTSWHVDTLLELVRDAEGRDTLDPEQFEEAARWTHTGTEQPGAAASASAAGPRGGSPDPATEGIPAYAFGPRRRGGRAPVRDFAGRRQVPGREAADFEDWPHLVLLGTARDEPADWLRAGQAMERVLLAATRAGLATSLTSHAVEHADLRRLVRDPQSTMAYVQMVLRLGYGPSGPATPRRPVGDVLDPG